MSTINKVAVLKDAIALLETKKAVEFQLLKTQFVSTYTSLTPSNLILKKVREFASAPLLNNKIVHNVIGLAAAYFSKKIVLGTTHNPIKKLIGTLIEFAVANAVSKKNINGKQNKQVLLAECWWMMRY